MNYYEKQRAYVSVALALRNASWNLYGYHEDESDILTDYWSPAYWNGCAINNDGYLVVNDYRNSDGHDITKLRNVTSKICDICNGTGIAPNSDEWNLEKAKYDPIGFHNWFDKYRNDGAISLMKSVVSPLFFNADGTLKCLKCQGKGKKSSYNESYKEVVDHYPKYIAPRKRVMFHLLAPDGETILKEWRALKPFSEYINNDILKNNLNKMLSDIDAAIAAHKNVDNKMDKEVVATSISDLELVEYSEKAIAIFGNTRPHKDELKNLGGRFNPRLKHNGEKEMGWIFPKSKLQQIENYLNSI